MAELDEIVQRIMLDGDTEILRKLRELAETGSESFDKISEAAEKGGGGFEAFGSAISNIVTALGAAAAAITTFVEINDEAVQKTGFLAEAFGTTVANISAAEAAFAQAGVSTAQFEQFAQRLTITIAREWPQIAENARLAADQQDSANQRVEASILRIKEAQDNLALASERSDSAVASAALREQEAYIKLNYAAQEAFASIIHGENDVQGADLSLEAAEQRLATLQGRPPSAAEKQSLELKQAQLAVDKARQASEDALRKQMEDLAEVNLKQKKAEQEAADAALRHETALNEAAVARQKAELAVKEAITARAEAEERAAQIALKDIPQIAKAIDSIIAGNKEMANGFDISQVRVRDLVNGIILAGSEGSKLPPEGMKVMQKLMELLHNDTNHLIDDSQRLAIVQQLSQRGFSTVSSSAFELLKVLERGPEVLTQYQDASNKAFANTDKAKENVEKFKDALSLLAFNIDLVNRSFAAAASPRITAFFEALNASLTEDGGLLHMLVSGIGAVGSALGTMLDAAVAAFGWVDKLLNKPDGTALHIVLTTITVLVVAFGSAWVAIPALIAAVVTVIGYIIDHMDKVKEGAAAAWEKFKDTGVYKFLETVIGYIKKIISLIAQVGKGLGLGSGAAGAGGAAGASEGGSVEGHADGGYIRGPGTGTSDSIVARLSNGEYVQRAAAVAKYGVDFMHSINNLTFPAFASGGLVGAPARTGGGNVQASRSLNLTIDGRTFSGFRGPANVVGELQSFAIARQTSAAGRNPSWVK